MKTISRLFWPVFIATTVVFMLSPLVLVVLFSFGENPLTAFPLGGVTGGWYAKLYQWSEFWAAFRNSAIITGVVGVVSTVVGTGAAVAIARMKERVASAALIALGLPLMLPALVIGLSLLSAFSLVGMKLGLTSVILAHLVFTQPFVIFVVNARMVGFDYAAVESARDLGASPLRAFFTVTLPIVRPTVIGAGLIAMALSLDDFIITFFTIGGGNTLPTLVWGMLRTSLDPTINALGTIIVVLTVGATVTALRLTRYRA